MNDFTLALRQLRKTPVFTAVAVLSIAIGIGANTAIFTLVNEFLLRSLPVKNPDELVLFRAIHGAQGRMSRRGEGPGSIDPATGRNSGTPFSLLAFERFRTHRSALADVFAYSPFSQVNVLVDGVPETTVSAQFVSGSYYDGLGVTASVGRTLTNEDDQPSAPPVAVISYRFWANRFGRDPAVLGETIAINRVPATIVGVTPAGFDGALQAGEVGGRLRAARASRGLSARARGQGAAVVLVGADHGPPRARGDGGTGPRVARTGLSGGRPRRLARESSARAERGHARRSVARRRPGRAG